MARPEHLFVFTYDISRDRTRERVAERLEEVMTRVQLSVFEGRMTTADARRLADRVFQMIGPDDSLRVYCVTEAGLKASLARGGPPLAEVGDFWLL